jgi:hypothetical protein
MPNLFIAIGLPFVIVAIAITYLLYVRILRPSPVALGCVIPKVCVVSADEIREYCQNDDNDHPDSPTRGQGNRQTRWIQFRVAWKYIALMIWNTKLFQQWTAFERLRIDPLKLSLDYYATRETLILTLAEEAAAVRVLLLKSQIALLARIFSTNEIGAYALERLQGLMREYKHLEFEAVALVRMAKDECHYTMLVERLGLSDWRIIEGDLPAS